GVTDLKAAVRYYRYNNDSLPGDTDRIFTFGHSGGGAQSALMGATGDSELYNEYLVSIGAAMFDEDGNSLSDAICGAMCWCPITSLDYADAAYEWNMGQYSTEGTRAENTWTSALSQDLAESYAAYINDLQLADEEGEILKLEKSADGIYTSGSYYNYLLSVV
ncbi:esterase, partial [Intestinibacillus massiliensis]|nr:esterase [Intestinibacillus massiliensis]